LPSTSSPEPALFQSAATELLTALYELKEAENPGSGLIARKGSSSVTDHKPA